MFKLRTSLIGLGAALAIAVPTSWSSTANAEPTPTFISTTDHADPKAEEQALHKFLTDKNISHRMEVIDGVETVTFDESDEAAWEAIREFYGENLPSLAESNEALKADLQELAEYLVSQGFDAKVVTDETGISEVKTDEKNPAILEAIDEFWWNKYPMTQEEINTVNAEQQKLADHLTSLGFTVTLEANRHGVKHVDTDWSNPEIQKAAEEFMKGKAVVLASDEQP